MRKRTWLFPGLALLIALALLFFQSDDDSPPAISPERPPTAQEERESIASLTATLREFTPEERKQLPVAESPVATPEFVEPIPQVQVTALELTDASTREPISTEVILSIESDSEKPRGSDYKPLPPGVGMTTRRREEGGGITILSTLGPRVELPPQIPLGKVSVRVHGYRELLLESVMEGVTQTVELELQKHLYIHLLGQAEQEGDYEVRIYEGDRLLQCEKVWRDPAKLRFEIEDQLQVRVEIARSSLLGHPRVFQVQQVALHAEGDTTIELSVALENREQRLGSMRVTLRSIEPMSSQDRWRMSLLPHEQAFTLRPSADLGFADITAFRASEDQRVFTRVFEEITSGSYILQLRPLGKTTPVEIREGLLTEVDFHLPELARVRIVPVDSEGNPISRARAGKLGVERLGFKGSTVGTLDQTEGSSSLQAFVTARAFFSKLQDDSWHLLAEPGVALRISALGSQKNSPAPFVFTPERGESKVLMKFPNH